MLKKLSMEKKEEIYLKNKIKKCIAATQTKQFADIQTNEMT